ncbi:MAG: cell envelope biogenesis protein OmpA, partial [Polyangiaceae bacterium]
MRSTRNLVHIVSVSALLLAGVLSSRTAHAEADTFGIGSGRTGVGSITTAGAVVNAYASITPTAVATGASSITVNSAAGFAAGDLILIWQTTGVAAAISGSPAATDLSLVPTGSFEYARIKSVVGAVVTLTNPIVSATGFAANTSQIVRIPEYTTLSITGAGTITAAPWNGTKGGIVAIFANNTVTNNTLISAATSGFRGGVLVNDDLVNGCSANDGPVVAALVAPLDFNLLAGGAKKGEGLLPADFSTSTANPTDVANLITYGRGNITNGGGGGDCSNSGG